MASKGGVKLTLEPATSHDRRIRSARLILVPSVGGDLRVLVTDTKGRINYRLDYGDYRLSVSGAPDVEFRVGDHRWTSVRLPLI